MLANVNRNSRVLRVRDMLDWLIEKFYKSETFQIEELLATLGLAGRILDVQALENQTKISDQTKSAVTVRTQLASALKCPLCNGVMFPSKSVSYDHILDIKYGGTGHISNVQQTHPYCNSIKGHELKKAE